jgi:N-acetyl-gamma-glutamyl-phosphate reductase
MIITKSIGIVGARGYTGEQLLGLLAKHSGFELDFVSSRKLAGQPVADQVEGFDGGLHYEELSPRDVAQRAPHVCVLALPNDISPPFVAAIEELSPSTIIVDLSSDYRFDDQWTYGQTERFRDEIKGAKRIANPGCYATGMQLGLWPLLDWLAAPPQVFGVSGYSGAGTTPSPKNDPDVLGDNLLPYSLTDHTHEREVSRHLGRQIYFSPHVAPFFRGITLTISVQLDEPRGVDQVRRRFEKFYAHEALIKVVDQAPLVRDNVGEHSVSVGGFDVTDDHLVFVVTLDNLLKGAATQALQNANLACGFDELEGLQ